MLMELAYSFHLLHDLACLSCVPLSTALSRVICTATQSEMRWFLWAVEEFWSKREPARGKKIWWCGLVCCRICCCHRRGHRLHCFLLPWTTGCGSWFPFSGRGRHASLLPLFFSDACSGNSLSSLKLDFLNHPLAVVLLVIDRTKSLGFNRFARMSTHGDITAARCLNKLLDARNFNSLGR